MQILVLCSLVLSCFATPVVQQSPSELASYAYAVDLSAPTNTSAFQCMRQSLYNIAFVRGYAPTGQGSFDTYACANIQNANAAGLGAEVYMTPQPNSVKTGSQQFDELYGGLRNQCANTNVRFIWIQVTSPVNWFSTSTSNINFLNSILSRASQYGLSIGIYTSIYDWTLITGGATINNALLWYWSTYGSGVSNESPANFNDFGAFGGWSTPTVKQFAQVESVCGVTVNRNVYDNAAQKIAGMAKYEKSEQIVVGSLGLGNAVAGMAEIKQ